MLSGELQAKPRASRHQLAYKYYVWQWGRCPVKWQYQVESVPRQWRCGYRQRTLSWGGRREGWEGGGTVSPDVITSCVQGTVLMAAVICNKHFDDVCASFLEEPVISVLT